MGLPMHLPGFFTNGDQFPTMLIYGHNGRFVNHHLVIVNDNRIGSAEVNGIGMNEGDGARIEVSGEIRIAGQGEAEVLLFDLP